MELSLKEKRKESVDDLVNKLKAKELSALNQLYDMYSGALLGVILKVLKDLEEGEEVLQDTFIKVWLGIDTYDKSKGSLFNWMINVARHSVMDRTRSRLFINSLKNISLDNNEDLIDSQKPLIINTDLIGLKRYFSKLPKDQSLIIELTYFYGFTQIEVAQFLEMPLGILKSKVRIAMNTLRTIYTEVA